MKYLKERFTEKLKNTVLTYNMKKDIKYIIVISLLILIVSCKINYSFSGADIDPNIKTVSIGVFENESGNGPANMSNLFTNALKEKVLRQSNLNLVNSNADISFTGKIDNYYYSIQAPTGNETSDLRRITMSVSVQFKNAINDDPKESWTKSFQSHSDHNVSVDLTSIEEESLEIINNLLVDEIFNKAFVKW